jgi:acetyl esterase/lipase
VCDVDPLEVLDRPAALPDAVLRYGPHDDGLIDVRLPDTSLPAPLVVVLHGGFWRQRWNRTHVRPMADALAADGCVVAAPEYRRAGAAAGWQATFDDVRTAVARLPQLLGGLGVRFTSTTLTGHSAGGHLALWLATEGVPVDRVVGLAPVADLRYAAANRLGGDAVVGLLGGTPDQVPERYDAADPAVRFQDRPSCPVLVVHGADDEQVPVASSRGLVVRHPWIDYRELTGVEHFGLIDPLSAAWPAVRDALRADRQPIG